MTDQVMCSSSEPGQNALMLPVVAPSPLTSSGEHVPPVAGAKSLSPDPGLLSSSAMPMPNALGSIENFK